MDFATSVQGVQTCVRFFRSTGEGFFSSPVVLEICWLLVFFFSRSAALFVRLIRIPLPCRLAGLDSASSIDLSAYQSWIADQVRNDGNGFCLCFALFCLRLLWLLPLSCCVSCALSLLISFVISLLPLNSLTDASSPVSVPSPIPKSCDCLAAHLPLVSCRV